MNNLNSIVDYLKVFNNIETYKKPEPRNMYAGGQLVRNTADGSRPGYGGPRGFDLEAVEKAINSANSQFKYTSLDNLAKGLDGVGDGTHLKVIIKRQNLPKVDSYAIKAEKAFIELFKDSSRNADEVIKPLHKIAEMMEVSVGKERVRIENISNALKNSKNLNYAEDIKPLINKLSSANFIEKIQGEGWRINDVESSIHTKSMLKAPKTDAQFLMNYVVRHQNQAGGDAVFSIFDKNNPNKRITNMADINSYHDIIFKDSKGKIYDMDYLLRNSRTDPMFKEYYNLQDQLKVMRDKKHWPDGSKIIDHTGKHVTFGNYSGSMYTHGYGYKKPYERFPYETDHLNLKEHPFKNLKILPQRINVAIGAADRLKKPHIKSKIGADHFRNLSIDDLMMQEKALGEKILIFDKEGKHIGKKLQTPYTAAKIKAEKPIKAGVEASGIKGKNRINILNAFCGKGGRKKFATAGAVEGLVCSMDEIQGNIKKQTKEALKFVKDGKIPKQFGKLRSLGMLFGWVDAPIELMFAAPHLIAGDIEGAKRATTAGIFGWGKVDLDKISDEEAKRYLKHTKAMNDYSDNYGTAVKTEEELKNVVEGTGAHELITQQFETAKTNMDDIQATYQDYGYTYEEGDTPIQGKVATQKYIRDKVESDFEKKIENIASNETFQDADQELLKEQLRDLGGRPEKATPITDLESYMENKGEEMAGNTNLFFNVEPYVLEEAEALGVPEIFDDYALGAGVEGPGRKSLQDAYSEIPLEYAGGLAALEKKQLEEGLKKKRLEKFLQSPYLSQGGIASLNVKR